MDDDTWTCPACEWINLPTRTTCERCNTSREGTPPPTPPDPSAPPPISNPNWHLIWMFVLLAIGIVWWLPISFVIELAVKDPSSGIIGAIVMLVWGVVGRFGKWGIIVLASSVLFYRNLPPQVVNKVFNKFALLSGGITVMEIVAYYTLLGTGSLENGSFIGFMIDTGFPITGSIITLYLIRRAQSEVGVNEG